MPKALHPELADCLRRPNPYIEKIIEISAPDVSTVLRRPDQLLGADSLLVEGSTTPANSFSNGPGGGLQMAGTSSVLTQFTGEQSSYDLNKEDPQRRLKGLSWKLDAGFSRAVLRNFVARVGRNGLLAPQSDFELQIYRVMRTPGVRLKTNANSQQTTSTAWTEYAFTPLLPNPAVVKAAAITWASNEAWLTFPLANYNLVLENLLDSAVSPDQTGEMPNYYFVVRAISIGSATGLFQWLTDTASSQVVADVGTFKRVFWARNSDQEQWVPTEDTSTPNFRLEVETFPATAQAVYVCDLGRAPVDGAIGRAVFERRLPAGCEAELEISTDGAAGTFTAITHGDVIEIAQQTYHLRVTLTSDTPHRATPAIIAFGVEFRTIFDVSLESILELPTRQVDVPWGPSSIGEGKLTVLRTGARDYMDSATMLGSSYAAPKLEVDVFLGSRHPAVGRDKWLRLERMTVSSRVPTPTGEVFTLLSYMSKLKKKIPFKTESINSVHSVAAGTTADQVVVTPNLVGATSDTAYDGKHYYMRVRSTGVGAFPNGFRAEITSNTSNNKLDFTPALPGVLEVGDVIEVHSGAFAAPRLSWQNADPRDVWEEILFTHLGIPVERVGHGALPRGGFPPSIEDRAPGDVTTQNKLRVSNSVNESTKADELIDQLDALMGGVTIEVDGQICWISLYEHRGLSGAVTVPLPAVSRIFDVRDFSGLQTPPGIDKRSTVMSAGYGVNHASVNPDLYAPLQTQVIDADALDWLTQQDLEEVGAAEVPERIAKWCYNTYDQGLFLATQIAERPVRATSTGLRLFPFTLVDAQPDVLPGQSVVIITDQYTDYDPASGTKLSGTLAIRGTVVSVGPEGKQLSIYVKGLAENVAQLVTSKGSAPVIPDPATELLVRMDEIEGTETHHRWKGRPGLLVNEVRGSWGTYPQPLPPPGDPLLDGVWDEVKEAAQLITRDADGTFIVSIPKPADGYSTLARYTGYADDAALTPGEPTDIRIDSPVTKTPEIKQIVTRGTLLDLYGNDVVKSWGVFVPGAGTWEHFADGQNITIDVSKVGTTGLPGIGPTESWELTIRAFVEPTAYVTNETVRDEDKRVVAGASAVAVPDWEEFTLSPPANDGDFDMKIRLKATDDTSVTARLFYRSQIMPGGEPSDWVNITASVSPGLTTPPTVGTDYQYVTTFERETNTELGATRTAHTVRAEILDAGGAVVRSETKTVSWYIPGGV